MKRHSIAGGFAFLATSLAVVGLTLLIPKTARSQDQTPVDHFKCYNVDSIVGFTPVVVSLQDQFGSTQSALLRPATLCNPVDKNGEGINDPTAHLTCYTIEEHTSPGLGLTVQATNQFGSDLLRIGIGRKLCVPSEKDLVPSELALDHYKCYEAKSTSLVPQSHTVTLTDQFGTGTQVVGGAKNLCTPVDKNEEGIRDPATHLECYDITNPPTAPLNRKVIVRNQFGIQKMVVKAPSVLCLPSQKKVCRTFCDGECTDTSTDANNCGACGNACAAGAPCVDGECVGSGNQCAKDAPCSDASVCSDGCGGACFFTGEGNTRCFFGEFDCSAFPDACTSGSDCPSGWGCASTCCGQTCVPFCGTVVPFAPRAPQGGGQSSQ